MAELKISLIIFGASCAQSADSSSRQNITNRTEFLSSTAFSLITTFITSCERFFTFGRQSRECGLMFGGCAAVLPRSSKLLPVGFFWMFLLSFFSLSSLFLPFFFSFLPSRGLRKKTVFVSSTCTIIHLTKPPIMTLARWTVPRRALRCVFIY